MNENPVDEFLEYDGAYVLGALSDDDRIAFEAHLQGCAECLARVGELAALPGLLELAPTSAFASAPAQADPVVALLKTARARRNKRRWIAAVGASAAAACLIAVTALIASNSSSPKPVAAAPVPSATMSAVVAAPIHATIEVTDVAWGSSIKLHCTYDQAASYPSDEEYSLVVRNRAGEVDNLGSWALVPGKVTNFPAGTAFHKADIASITVATADGTPLLQLSY